MMFLSVTVISSCRKKETVSTFTFSGMGTVLNVIYTGHKNTPLEKSLKADVEKIERYFSYFDPESYISAINKKGYAEDISVPSEVCDLIELSMRLNKDTEGFFDITYKSERKHSQHRKENILTDCVNNKVKLLKKDTLLDLGGIAKGYAIDRAGLILKNHGVKNFIVNYGGDMLVCGKKGREPWKIGIRDPDNKDRILKTMVLDDECTGLATSGNYERFIEKDGSVHSHIIDPLSGTPANNSRSVTVVGRDATTVDALATAISASNLDEVFIKKIVDKFSVKIYTLSDRESVWKKYGTEN